MKCKGKLFFVSLLIELLACSGCVSIWNSKVPGFPSAMPSGELPAIRETVVETSLPRATISATPTAKDYRIGAEDELDISVYGDKELSRLQIVRPDGKIDFPLAGTIQASGLTADELRGELEQRLLKYQRSPQVTVIITKYNSRKLAILGEVKTPGILRLSSDIDVLEGLSRAGGLTDDADLRGSLLIREGQTLPLNFEKLVKQGDFTQNILLQANDVILIPNIKDKKVFVLGEVKNPTVVILKPGITLVEAVSTVGGFTIDAQTSNVLIIRGGLASPKIMEINVDEITKREQTVRDVQLQAGDIIYVPKTVIANVVQYFNNIRDILSPMLLATTGITQWPDVLSVLLYGKTIGQRAGTAVVIGQ